MASAPSTCRRRRKRSGRQSKRPRGPPRNRPPISNVRYPAEGHWKGFPAWFRTGLWRYISQKLPGLFPPDSRTGEKTRSAPAIWAHKQDFDAKAVVFAKVVAANRDKAKASLDGLKAAAKPVGDACDNCH